MNENIDNKELLEEESSIDFGKIFKDLLKHKSLYYKVLPITFVIAAILLLSHRDHIPGAISLIPVISAFSLRFI